MLEARDLRVIGALIRYTRKLKIVEHPSNLKLNSASHIRAEGSSHEPIWRGSVELPWYIYIYDTKRIAIRREREKEEGRRKKEEEKREERERKWYTNVYVVVDCIRTVFEKSTFKTL